MNSAFIVDFDEDFREHNLEPLGIDGSSASSCYLPSVVDEDAQANISSELLEPIYLSGGEEEQTAVEPSCPGGFIIPPFDNSLSKQAEKLVPNIRGQYFHFTSDIAPDQQRERIAVNVGSNYSRIRLHRLPPVGKTPTTILSEVITQNLKRNFISPSSSFTWHAHVGEEIFTAKTTQHLSSALDNDVAKKNGSSSFFFRVRIIGLDEHDEPCTIDQFTSPSFRTVSHSKLCEYRKRKGIKKSRPKKSKWD